MSSIEPKVGQIWESCDIKDDPLFSGSINKYKIIEQINSETFLCILIQMQFTPNIGNDPLNISIGGTLHRVKDCFRRKNFRLIIEYNCVICRKYF